MKPESPSVESVKAYWKDLCKHLEKEIKMINDFEEITLLTEIFPFQN
jgi:hypothetical protein